MNLLLYRGRPLSAEELQRYQDQKKFAQFHFLCAKDLSLLACLEKKLWKMQEAHVHHRQIHAIHAQTDFQELRAKLSTLSLFASKEMFVGRLESDLPLLLKGIASLLPILIQRKCYGLFLIPLKEKNGWKKLELFFSESLASCEIVICTEESLFPADASLNLFKKEDDPAVSILAFIRAMLSGQSFSEWEELKWRVQSQSIPPLMLIRFIQKYLMRTKNPALFEHSKQLEIHVQIFKQLLLWEQEIKTHQWTPERSIHHLEKIASLMAYYRLVKIFPIPSKHT